LLLRISASGANLVNQRMHHRDIINLIYLLVKDNPQEFERFQGIIFNKIEAFLTPIINPTLYENGSTASGHATESSCLSVISSLFQVSGNQISYL
jgi:hypothetical protein